MAIKYLDRAVDCLVPIQRGEGQLVAFCLPGAGGSLASFLPLTEAMGTQVTAYGLLPFAISNQSELGSLTTVEAAAEICVKAILSVQRDGSYGLIGHSFGGWIAFEIALRLSAIGKKAFPVVLLDTDPPGRASKKRDRVAVLLKLVEVLEMTRKQELRMRRENLKDLTRESQLQYLLCEMKRVRLLPTTANINVVEGMVQTFETNINTSYGPRMSFGVEMWLAQPREEWKSSLWTEEDGEEELNPEAALAAWRNYAPYVQQIWIPGNHMTMLKAPNVSTIGELLHRLWNGRGSQLSTIRD